jgi:hypothetical protein
MWMMAKLSCVAQGAFCPNVSFPLVAFLRYRSVLKYPTNFLIKLLCYCDAGHDLHILKLSDSDSIQLHIDSVRDWSGGLDDHSGPAIASLVRLTI